MESISAVTITDKELEPARAEATAKLRGFSCRALREATPAPASEAKAPAYRPLQSTTQATPERELKLLERVQAIHPQDELLTDVEHHVLWVLRRAAQVYLCIHGYYEQASGLDRLKQANSAGGLGARQEPELARKLETGAAVSLFAFSAYLSVQLAEYQRDAADALPFTPEPPGKLGLAGRQDGLHTGLFYVYEAIDAHARDDASLVRAVRERARQLAERLAGLQHSLAEREFFARYTYRIEPEGVRIAGFELPSAGRALQVQVAVKRPQDVVGNHVAKLEASRIAQRLACYDRERQTNPFVELGGFVFTFIGDGSPGTGKTTLIQMIATLLGDYTQVAGLPFRYANFSIDEISDYQGRSGQNAKRFAQSILDPRGVGFGTIDDVDQVCGSRSDRHASAGQLEVTAVFMQEFAGAGTVVRGNASFGLFSNYPEKVDDALRQRMQARFLVDGPRTRDDFADLLHILLHRNFELPLGADYAPLSSQQIRKMVDAKYGEHDVPRSAGVRRVFEAIRGRGKGALASWRDFGDYLHGLSELDARFTGRAIRNIADAVRARMMNFDLPEDWLAQREPFFAKPYETRVAMLRELRGEITPEIVIQEINRYADSESRYAGAAEARELEDRTRQHVLEARARRAAAERES